MRPIHRLQARTVQLGQFECGHCRRYFTSGHSAVAAGAHATGRFLGLLAEHASHGDVATAARFLGVPERTAERGGERAG